MDVMDSSNATLDPNAGSVYFARTADSWFRGVVAGRIGALTVEPGAYAVSFYVGDNDTSAKFFTEVTRGGDPVSAEGTIGLTAGLPNAPAISTGESHLLEIKDPAVAASYDASSVPADGQWVLWTISYTVPENSPLIGQALGFMLKKPDALDAKGVLAFDGPLTIDYTPPSPEPPEEFSGDLTVEYLVEGGTATESLDYAPLPGTVTIPDGEASASVVIVPLADDAVEGDETLTVSLTPKKGYVVGAQNRATQTILDDFTPPPPEAGVSDWVLY